MLKAVVDVTKTPPILTVTSDRRKVSVDVTVLGEKVAATGVFPVTVTDAARTWVLDSDDGATAVYHAG